MFQWRRAYRVFIRLENIALSVYLAVCVGIIIIFGIFLYRNSEDVFEGS